MSFKDLLSTKTADEALEWLGILAQGLDVIDGITGNATALEATAIVNGVRSVIGVVKNGLTGGADITAASVQAELTTLDTTDVAKLAADDTKADASLDAKFQKGE